MTTYETVKFVLVGTGGHSWLRGYWFKTWQRNQNIYRKNMLTLKCYLMPFGQSKKQKRGQGWSTIHNHVSMYLSVNDEDKALNWPSPPRSTPGGAMILNSLKNSCLLHNKSSFSKMPSWIQLYVRQVSESLLAILMLLMKNFISLSLYFSGIPFLSCGKE